MENSEVDVHGVDVQRSEMFRVYVDNEFTQQPGSITKSGMFFFS